MAAFRSVRVQAVIERPPSPPGIVPPMPERATWWSGQLLAWRWSDRATRTWAGLVRYQREGLLYEHWISGEILEVSSDSCVTSTVLGHSRGRRPGAGMAQVNATVPSLE